MLSMGLTCKRTCAEKGDVLVEAGRRWQDGIVKAINGVFDADCDMLDAGNW